MIIYNFGEERLLNNWKTRFCFPKNMGIVLDKEVNTKYKTIFFNMIWRHPWFLLEL